MDEISKYPVNSSYAWRNMMAPLKKLFPAQKTFLSVSADRKDMNDIIDDVLDVKCVAGKSIDAALFAGSGFFEMLNGLNHDDKDELCSYYNLESIGFKLPKYQRLMNGWWLWHSPFAGNIPWAYQHLNGDPFDFRETDDEYDLNYTYPRVGKPPVSTLAWEAMAKGFDDMRYLDLLRVLAYSTSPNAAKAKELLAVLETYVRKCRNALMILDSETDALLLERTRHAMAALLAQD